MRGANMAPDELDKALPEWWKSWKEWEAKNRPFATTFTDTPRSGSPDAQKEPELHLIARDCFGFRNAGRAFEPGHPDNQLESHLHLTRKPGATALDFEGDDPGIVTVTALGWGSAPAIRPLLMLHVYATRDPERQHYQLAEAVIRVAEKGREATEKERRALAEAICEAARELAKRLEWDADGLLKLPWWDADSSARALERPREKPAPRDPARDARLVAAGFHVPKPVSEEEHERYEQHMARWQHGRVVNEYTLNLAGSLGKVADLLEGLGIRGQAWAELIRGTPEDSELWARPIGPSACPDGPTRSPVFWALAETLWLDKVKPGLLAEAKRKPPALVRVVVADQILPAMSGQLVLPGVGQNNELKNQRGRTVALLDGEMALVIPGLDKLRTVTGQRFLNLAASTICLQEERGEQYPNIITIEGGLSGLAALLQHDKGDTKTLRELLETGYAVRWKTDSGYGEGWWTYRITRGGPGRPGEITMTLADMWRPNYVYAMPGKSPKNREDRRLIPVPREEPPVGKLNPKHQGQGWIASRRVMVELVDQAERLYENGGAKLDDKAWRRIQDASELSPSVLASVKEAFFQGDGERPPLLKDAGKGLVTLADAHDLEREFILEGGEMRVTGRESGLKSQEAKARARAKRSRKGNTPG